MNMPLPELLILPILTLIVFYGDYWINTKSTLCLKKNQALREASWWSVAFFGYGIIDRMLCSSSLLVS